MTKFEIVQEIITVCSILVKSDCEDVMEKRDTFIEFLNEIGIRNDNGNELNLISFKKLIESLTEEEKELLIEEFNEGFEGIYRHLMMQQL